MINSTIVIEAKTMPDAVEAMEQGIKMIRENRTYGCVTSEDKKSWKVNISRSGEESQPEGDQFTDED